MQRTILWYLVFVGFAINYCIRINVNIAIVDMIDESFRKSTNKSIIESECFEKLPENFTVISENESADLNFAQKKEEKKRFASLERKLLDTLGVNIVGRKQSHAIKQLIRK